MNKLFNETVNNILEGYGIIHSPPLNLVIQPGSYAEKVISQNKMHDLIQGFYKTRDQFATIATMAVWEKMRGKQYANRVGDPNVDTILKLKGKNNPRAIGKIEGDTFYVYWLGTHENLNQLY
jgi:hypothetical protein